MPFSRAAGMGVPAKERACFIGISLACAALAPLLSGCSSRQTVEQVTFGLADENHSAALERGDGPRVVRIKDRDGGVSLAFSAYLEGQGSGIEYRKESGTIGGIWKQCVGAREDS